jgi:hypothetical protein
VVGLMKSYSTRQWPYIYIYIFSLSFFLEQIKNKRTKLKIIIIEGISMIMITNNQPRKSHNGNFHWNQ